MFRRFTLTIILLFIASLAFAQEGDPIEDEERVESEIIIESDIDSASKVELPISKQIKKNESSDFFLGVGPKSGVLPSNSDKDSSAKAVKSGNNKSSYNFLYYLFYKFKKVDNQVEL